MIRLKNIFFLATFILFTQVLCTEHMELEIAAKNTSINGDVYHYATFKSGNKKIIINPYQIIIANQVTKRSSLACLETCCDVLKAHKELGHYLDTLVAQYTQSNDAEFIEMEYAVKYSCTMSPKNKQIACITAFLPFCFYNWQNLDQVVRESPLLYAINSAQAYNKVSQLCELLHNHTALSESDISKK